MGLGYTETRAVQWIDFITALALHEFRTTNIGKSTIVGICDSPRLP